MKNKLKNKQGVTMLMALLFLLLAIMICGAILVAAVSAADAYRDSRRQQQAYLSVSSAAQLLKNQLADTKLEINITKKYEILQKDEDTGIIKYGPEEETTVTTVTSKSLKSVWEAAMTAVAAGNNYTGTFQIEQEQLGTVTVELSISAPDYALTAKLYNADCCLTVKSQMVVSDPSPSPEERVEGEKTYWYIYDYTTYALLKENISIEKPAAQA